MAEDEAQQVAPPAEVVSQEGEGEAVEVEPTPEAEEKKDDVKPTKVPKKKSAEIYNLLSKMIDKELLTTDEMEQALYGHDTAPIPNMLELGFNMTPDVILMPQTADDVINAVKIARKNEIPIVPRGTSTWALGGSVPVRGGILIDMSHMDRIYLDEDNFCVTVDAGITWKKVYDYCLARGYLLGAYPSSALGSTVGGWVNTGGIGIGSYKYGGAYDQVRNLEVVLPSGELIQTGSHFTISNQGGYNLNGLFVGSEGTLGIVTRATLKLRPAPEEFRPVSFSFDSMDNLAKAVFHITRERVTPLHIGFVDGRHLEALKALGKDVPKANALLNMTLEGTKDDNEKDEEILTGLATQYTGKKLAPKVAEHEWEERFYEFRTKRLGPSFITSTIFAPMTRFPEIINAVEDLANSMKVNLAITGVVPDRSTVDYMPYFLTDERRMTFILTTSFTKKLADVAFKHDGRAVGLGVWMANNLPRLTANSAKTMYDIKSAIDPYDIMNPGKLVEIGTRFGFPVPATMMNIGMDTFAFLKGLMPKDKLPEQITELRAKEKEIQSED